MVDLLFDSDDHEEMKKDMGKILSETWVLVFTNNENQSNSTTTTTTTTTTTSPRNNSKTPEKS